MVFSVVDGSTAEAKDNSSEAICTSFYNSQLELGLTGNVLVELVTHS